MEVQGITAGVNMWALLRADDPGESATFLAAKRTNKKRAAVAVEVEEPPAINGTGDGGKAAKRGAKAKDSKNKNKKLGAADKQAAEKEADGEVQKTDGRKGKRGGRKGKEAPPAAASGRCRAVAERICKAVVAAMLLALSYNVLVSAAHPVAGGRAI